MTVVDERPTVHVLDALKALRDKRRGVAGGAFVPGQRPTGDGDDPFSAPTTITDPTAWVASALGRNLDELAAMESGGRNAAAHALGRSVGMWEAGGLPVNVGDALERIVAACDANGLVDDDGLRTAHESIKSGYRWGLAHPYEWEQAPTRAGATVTAEAVLATSPAASPDGDTALLDAEVRAQRIRRDAKRQLDAEEAAAKFVSPGDGWRGDKFIAENDEPEVWLFDPILPYGANATLTAPFKTGKTTFMANLLAALLDKVPLAGRWPMRTDPGNVAVWDFEMTRRQYRRWLRDVGAEHMDRLHGHTLRGSVLDLLTTEGAEWAVRWLAEREVGVWIVDPFARAFKDDENDNSLVTRWTDQIDVIKARAGVHSFVMPVHSGRREGDDVRARGATRLDDWPDVRWILRKDKDTGRRSFKASGRDVDIAEVGLTYDEVTRRYTADDRSLAAMTVDAAADALLAVLPAAGGAVPGMSKNDAIEAAFGAKNSERAGEFNAALHALEARGAVTVSRPSGPGRGYQIWRTPEVVRTSAEGLHQ